MRLALLRWLAPLCLISASCESNDKPPTDVEDTQTGDSTEDTADSASDVPDDTDDTDDVTTPDADTSAEVDTTDDTADTTEDDTTDTSDADTTDTTDTTDTGSDTTEPPEGCCLSAFEDCGLGAVCVPADGFEFGQCKGLFPSGCWMDSQCSEGETCEGEQVCPCGASCFAPDAPGVCKPSSTLCCGSDNDCNDDFQCAPGPTGKGTCKDPSSLEPGACWADDDCNSGFSAPVPAPSGGVCLGERVCPCDAMCVIADAPGTCAKKGCCLSDSDCASGECASLGGTAGTCKLEPLADGTCWSDDDCSNGERCNDARICPCDALCILPDAPGTCGPTSCKTLDPFGYGLCDMVLGVVFDGSSCTYASGCGCGEDCAYIFDSIESCEASCLR
jgi:hypothetical protein